LALVIVDHIADWTAAPRTRGGSMVVYLGEGVSDATAHQLVGQLGRVAGVERAELVAPADAAKRLERALGADAALLDGVDLASLPATVEVTLAPGVRDVISMSPLLGALRANSGVEDVIVEDGGDTAKSTDTLATVRAFVYAGAALLAGLAIVVVLAAIRLRLESDRQEHAVLHLLGAPPLFSIVPAALAGAALGLVASLGASLLVWFGIDHFALGAPALGAITLFVASGAGLGLIGGGLAGVARVAR
ncbi:MAG TPA: permease-like cell division protein FtsX, partial [Kofleriaceae bacterium]|nr:permease-like cell division protein FtsX [Kofleriaceae bacterium]